MLMFMLLSPVHCVNVMLVSNGRSMAPRFRRAKSTAGLSLKHGSKAWPFQSALARRHHYQSSGANLDYNTTSLTRGFMLVYYHDNVQIRFSDACIYITVRLLL